MDYAKNDLTREEVDAFAGPAVLEFGANGCGFCARAQRAIETALANHPDVRHLKIEDGKGWPLGRSFGVKLWPTLIFMKDGKEVARLVRPSRIELIDDALDLID